MLVALRPGSALRFRLQPGTFLYDCHAGQFAPADGADLVAGFMPFLHAALFGATPGAWHPYFTQHVKTIATLAPAALLTGVGRLRGPGEDRRCAHARSHACSSARDWTDLLRPRRYFVQPIGL